MIRAILLSLLPATLLHAVTIPHTEASKHVGEEVTVTGKVTDIWTIDSGVSFVKFGSDPVADAFSAVAKPEVLDRQALHAFKGKQVTGTVEMQNEKPKIVLKTADSIRLSATAPAPETTQQPEPAPANFVIEALDIELERDEIKVASEGHKGFVPKSAEVVIAYPLNFKPAATQRVLVVVPEMSTEAHL